MSAVPDVRGLYRAEFQRMAPLLPGADVPWLRGLRQRAFEQFMDQGFPTVRNEDWKYTDVRSIAARPLTTPTAPGVVDAASLPRLALGGPVLVFVDGHYAPSLSVSVSVPVPGVRLANVREMLATQAGFMEPWLGCLAEPRDGFSALNVALMQDGAFVHIARGLHAEAPIQLLFVATGLPDAGIYPRNLIVAEPGSRATVVESYWSTGQASYLTDVGTAVMLGADAQLEHYRLEREAPTASHIGVTDVHFARNSRYVSHSVTLGARLARHALHCNLDEEGAQCELDGLYVGSGRQHMDHSTRIEHRVPHCTSREWYRGVMDEHARGVFSGRVVVHPQAQHTDAGQQNHNLLLAAGAEADSRPQFEIYADDVKCAHGSSTGTLDADALFYLRARGLDEAAARQLLVYAFADDVLRRMTLAPVRGMLEHRLRERWALQPDGGA